MNVLLQPIHLLVLDLLAPLFLQELRRQVKLLISLVWSEIIVISFISNVDPSGTPSNTSGVALNSTHIYIDWDPPPEEQHHGELREYRIAIHEIETSTSSQVSSAPDVTEAIIGPLHPYYTYNCTILAVTAGEGPPSTVITVRTEEDGRVTNMFHKMNV